MSQDGVAVREGSCLPVSAMRIMFSFPLPEVGPVERAFKIPRVSERIPVMGSGGAPGFC